MQENNKIQSAAKPYKENLSLIAAIYEIGLLETQGYRDVILYNSSEPKKQYVVLNDDLYNDANPIRSLNSYRTLLLNRFSGWEVWFKDDFKNNLRLI